MDNKLRLDHQIQAYIDNELSLSERVEFTKQLKKDSALQQRVDEYAFINDQLKMQSIDDTEVIPERLIASALNKREKGFHLSKAAGYFLLGGIIGYLITYSFQATESHRMVANVAEALIRPAVYAHAVFSPEVKHPVEVAANQKAHLVTWVSKRLDEKITAPELSEFDFQLIGGRVLPSNNGIAAQFMYENSSNKRVTLYIVKLDKKIDDVAFSVTESNNQSVYFWVDNSFGYAVSGKVPKSTVLALGEKIYSQYSK